MVIIIVAMHGGWISNTVAEGYVDESVLNKMDWASKILIGGQNSRNIICNPASSSAKKINNDVVSVVEKSINISSCSTKAVSADLNPVLDPKHQIVKPLNCTFNI